MDSAMSPFASMLMRNEGQIDQIALAQRPVVVIDNGSYECRVGWSLSPTLCASQQPWAHQVNKSHLRFKNQIAKPKNSYDKDVDAVHIVGDELSYFEQSKLQKKQIFDKDIVTNQGNLEHLLDYSFYNIGIRNQIESPVMMTEPLCNPNRCRALTSELMFECYGVPALSYVVDHACGYFWHQSNQIGSREGALADGLVIHSGHHSTHVVPIIDGKMSLKHSKRIPLGGHHHTEMVQRSLTLKYPQHKGVFGYEQALYIHQNHSFCAYDYAEQITFLEKIYDAERDL